MLYVTSSASLNARDAAGAQTDKISRTQGSVLTPRVKARDCFLLQSEVHPALKYVLVWTDEPPLH